MRSYAAIIINRPSPDVWHMAAPFGGIGAWHPLIASCKLETEHGEVGAVRLLRVGEATIRERLIELDHDAKTLAYEFVESPFEVSDYHAVLKVSQGETPDSSTVEWWTDFTADQAGETDWTAFFRDEVFTPGLAALKSALETPRTVLVTTGFHGSAAEAQGVYAAAQRRLSDVEATLALTTVAGRNSADQHHLMMLVPGDKATPEVITAAEGVPYTGTEVAKLCAELPLTLGLAHDYSDLQPFRDLALVITGHFVTDLVPMVHAAIRMGAAAEAITVLRKEYSYGQRARVEASLTELGVTVWPIKDVVKGLREHTRRANEANLNCLAIDDGGYVIPALLAEAPELLPSYRGVVEQTMSGIFKLEPFPELPVPVFAVAQSRLKTTIESYWIADTAVFNILDLLPDEKIEGQAALVIGFGNIGNEIARVLRDRRMRVAVFDRDLIRLISAHESGFATSLDVEEIMRDHRPILIIGTTGRTCMSRELYESLQQDCFLASVSSRNTEFDLAALTDMATQITDLGRLGTRYALSTDAAVTVLADGYPVNFHHADSVTNSHSDLICAALLLGAAILAEPRHGFADGHNKDRTDAVLESSGLLEHYYRLYGPKSVTPAIGRSLDPARYAPRALGLPTPQSILGGMQ